MPLAILAAMNEEIHALRPYFKGESISIRAGREFVRGDLFGHDAVMVFSRWGKVASASTVTELIVHHQIESLVMVGIAGSVSSLSVGDVVIADSCVQHDMDPRPFFPRTHIPLLERAAMPVDDQLSIELADATQRAMADIGSWLSPELAQHTRITAPRVVRGCIATGDQIIASASQRANVLDAVPTALCVDMESAAVAQVAYEHGIPFACARVISDAADEAITSSVVPFLGGLAAAYSVAIVRAWLKDR